MTLQKEKRNPYLSKWNVLFENTSEQWISFQPRIGRTAYPCFACRDMFANRNSFLDHINRRGMVLKYYCTFCKQYMTFYNICSFLLHARTHFTDVGGSVDLENVDISTINMDIAGFLPLPEFPRIFDVEETIPNYNLNLSVKFYKPKSDCLGTRVVFFEPNEFIFYSTVRNDKGVEEKQAMMLLQVSPDIPKCEFIPILAKKNNSAKECNNKVNLEKDVNQNVPETTEDSDDDVIAIDTTNEDVICLDDSSDDEQLELPPSGGTLKIKNIKNLLQPSDQDRSTGSEDEIDIKPIIRNQNLVPHCPECNEEQTSPMKDHFQQNDLPTNDKLTCSKCKLILPSSCAFRAHERIHYRHSPYVCPECGKDFDLWCKLLAHMEDVCFHLAKHIRYKCPAKNCGKVFAQISTFSAHLPVQHIAIRYTCDLCAQIFATEAQFRFHAKTHTAPQALAVTSYECLLCNMQFDEDVDFHIQDHVQKLHGFDKDYRIYIYTCKYCKGYYRSKNTYAAHLLRCRKLLLNTQVKKEAGIDKSDVKCQVIRYCKKCDCKIQFHCTYKDVKQIGRTCPQCNQYFAHVVPEDVRNDFGNKTTIVVQKEKVEPLERCILCNKIKQSEHKCIYAKPVVVLVDLNSVPTSSLSPKSSNSEDSVKRKRKKSISVKYKNQDDIKKNRTEEDPIEITPIIFNGEYICNICNFKSESRDTFHEHIQQHRDISTAYQCMECGECFVVKPSLMKHLQVLHLINDVEDYMNKNECFDKEAVRELTESMKQIPGESSEPVAENQCRVCRQLFSDKLELSKHFRVHGMAFLMKKIVK